MTVSEVMAHLQTIVKADATLKNIFTGNWLVIGTPTVYPSLCLDGIISTNDKLGTKDAFLNFWSKDFGGFGATFIDQATALENLLNNSGVIRTSGFVTSLSADKTIQRARFQIYFNVE